MGAQYCAPPRRTNMAAGNNANIRFQYRHKFDQLFTGKEQIIPLNTFSNTFTIQRAKYHVIKFFFSMCDGLNSRSPY